MNRFNFQKGAIILIILPFVVSMVFLYFFYGNVLQRQSQKVISYESEFIEHEVNNLFVGFEDLVIYLEVFIKSHPQREVLLNYLVNLYENDPYISSLYFYTSDFDMINATGYVPPPELDLTQRDWYILSLDSSDIIYTSGRLNLTSDRVIVTVAKAVYDADIFMGIIGIDVDITNLRSFISNIEVGEKGYAMLIDRQNKILGHPFLSNGTNGLLLDSTEIHESFSTFLNQKGQTNITLDGTKGVLTYRMIINNSFLLAVYLPIAEYQMIAQHQMMIIVGTVIFAGTLLIFGSIIYIKGVINPIDYLTDEISTLNLKTKPELRLKTKKTLGFTNVRDKINQTLDISHDYLQTIEKQVERLNYLATYDTLTGVKNRLAYEQDLTKYNKEDHLPLGLMMMDINGLKLINDSFGHFAGDQVIKIVTEKIKSIFSHDHIYRVGGDEFVVLLPNQTYHEIEEIKLKAIKAFERVIYRQIEITISFGYDVKTVVGQSITDVERNAENYMYRSKVMSRMTSRSKQIDTIMATLYEKSKREQAHSKRVSQLCQWVAEEINLNSERAKEVGIAGLLHDIGKIAIDEHILNKPGKLDENEWTSIKRHPEVGFNILNTVDEFKQISLWVLAHHERFDGKGYPRGLAGYHIPIESRIISVVDAFDAMTKDRTYRSPLSEEQAIIELEKHSGTQFDPVMVNALKNVLAKKKQ